MKSGHAYVRCVKDFLQIHISGKLTTDPRVGRRD